MRTTLPLSVRTLLILAFFEERVNGLDSALELTARPYIVPATAARPFGGQTQSLSLIRLSRQVDNVLGKFSQALISLPVNNQSDLSQRAVSLYSP